jgi:hypothetical protein
MEMAVAPVSRENAGNTAYQELQVLEGGKE